MRRMGELHGCAARVFRDEDRGLAASTVVERTELYLSYGVEKFFISFDELLKFFYLAFNYFIHLFIF